MNTMNFEHEIEWFKKTAKRWSAILILIWLKRISQKGKRKRRFKFYVRAVDFEYYINSNSFILNLNQTVLVPSFPKQKCCLACWISRPSEHPHVVYRRYVYGSELQLKIKHVDPGSLLASNITIERALKYISSVSNQLP